MEHKAFIFDHQAFTTQLSKSLANALLTEQSEGLVAFINENLASLKDPYEGLPLDSEWETLLEFKDVHQYGDFALTKFYDPSDDIGLGLNWQNIENILESDNDENLSILLGKPFGPPNNYFDPGKMGSYFQNEDEVYLNLKRVENIINQKPQIGKPLEELTLMLNKAVELKRGLYITF